MVKIPIMSIKVYFFYYFPLYFLIKEIKLSCITNERNQLMEETIKYFYEPELKRIFKVLEDRRITARTPYARKCAIRNEAFFKIMYYCAMRVSEVTNTEVDYFNPVSKEIYCKRIKGSLNNTLRIIDDDVYRSLKRHLSYNRPENYMFEGRNGKPMSRKTADAIIRSVCKEAKIKDINKWHCHTFKHTRAVILAEHGFDVKEVQYWLGHKEIENTLIYFQFTSKQNDSMYKKFRNGRM